MAIRTSPARAGTPCWVDLGTTDLQKSIEFYREMFGWEAEDQGEQFGHYHVLKNEGEMVGGLMSMPGMENGWTVYLASDDAQATGSAIEAAGGTIVSGAMQVGDQGTMLIGQDPAGSGFGVWQAGTNLGSALPGIGTPVWWENYTLDFPAARDFYAAAFGVGYEMLSDTDEFRYAQMKSGDDIVAGMMDRARDMPPGTGSYWQVYFGVEDVDKATAKLAGLGGQIMQPAWDSPYGRMSYVKDPQGAGLMLVTFNGALM